MHSLIAQITPEQRLNPAVKHALETRSALVLGDYCSFFRLYQTAPNMGPYLMDYFVKRERIGALAVICQAYRPSLPIRYLSRLLAFDSEPECKQFLQENGVVLVDDDKQLDTKLSLSRFN